MWKGECNPNSKNTVPLQVTTIHTSARKRGTISHEFDKNLQREMLLPEDNDHHSSEASRLMREGIQQQQAGDLIAAMKSLQESLALSQAFGDLERQAQTLSYLALVAYTSGDYKSAISYSGQCLSLTKDSSDLLRVKVQAFSHLGNSYRHLNEYEKAIEFLQECLKIAQA